MMILKRKKYKIFTLCVNKAQSDKSKKLKLSNFYVASLISLLALLLTPVVIGEEAVEIEQNLRTQQSIREMQQAFLSPSKRYYPETWFHLNGKNISKAGLTADLEAIEYSGMQGIQLFNKKGPAYPDVEQISILSDEWEDVIGHVADETERLGLNLTFQNCPGWSMAGGPWVPAEEAQRELVHHEFQFTGGQKINQSLAIAPEYQSKDRNYQDVQVIAFKTPLDHHQLDLTPDKINSNNKLIPWQSIFDKTQRFSYQYHPRVLPEQAPFKQYQLNGIHPVEGEPTWVETSFNKAVTIRTIELPPVRTIFTNRQYPKTNIEILVEAKLQGNWQKVTSLQVPSTNWYDLQYGTTLAIPTTKSEQFRFTFKKDPLFLAYLKLHSRSALHNHEAKASKTSRNLQQDIEQQVSKQAIIQSQDIVDITAHLTNKGELNWQAPAGNWTVIRFGHVNMLRTNRPAEPEATGWEASKLDKEAIENHLRNGMMGHLMRSGGPLDGHKIHGMLIDSWESYVPTWTMKKERLAQEFFQRRGYDMMPYLPATLGYVVDSVEISNKFLRDLRHTMDDLYVENFFDHFKTVAHDMGSKVYTEGAVGETLPGDPMRYYGVSDFPMTEFWYPKAPSNQKEAKPVYAAASAYHLYNKPFLAAEAATQLFVKWNETPDSINYLINENFAKGINHLVFHTFSHTPQLDVVPGSSFGGTIGFPMLRTQTWWRHTPEWMKQLARSQYMLQQGEFVADVLWYLGDELAPHPYDTAPFPDGYKFDYLNQEILHNKVKVIDGQLHVVDAGNYQLIRLRDSERMLLSTAKKLKSLVEQGAVILGNKPQTSPSLMDNKQDLNLLKNIADTLWGNEKQGVKSTGKGKVYWGYSLETVLKKEQIKPDIAMPETANIRWLHRQTANADIYFVSNQQDHAIDANLQFRVTGESPQLWDPKTGNIQTAKIWTTDEQNKLTNLVVSLAPHSSQFIVFSKSKLKNQATGFKQLTQNNEVLLAAQPGWVQHYPDQGQPARLINNQWILREPGRYQLHASNGEITEFGATIQTQVIDQPWTLAFESGWDTPNRLILKQLKPLQQLKSDAVKHYSGSITYSTRFNYQTTESQNTKILDLGQVHNIAQLKLNGKVIGTRFAPPFEFDVSNALLNGENHLEIVVTNTWRNQLIFDKKRSPGQKKTWTTNPPKSHETQLEPSGLIGPVKIRTQVNKN
ncbi:glycosyl hydrolase [Catenovulum adriaticum]|uniref:Glycosyl hydrolase n=1 Tax=Catenovulum adriaticum TaxID=2984846 RepID=A0ABY7AR47_9ALTE|nr:glycosyl hydrolase [Catenovulum sp. TS8]WAJ72022.1 glycosyl hydrolase [Catenovulum sp. TS8]